jgi:2-succinyl-6-hydroxy-2,4-cyclohexadiene-1-carboxylate synthase
VNAIREHLHEGEPIVFIGYSLGARLAMVGKANRAYKELNLRGYFLEGGNFGLQDNHEKEQRWNADQRWANRFLSEPIEHVLTDWYQQPVFESLNDKQRDELISNRAHNSGSAIAQMLVATSLAKQPFLLDELVSSESFVHYLCGEQDKKFLRLAEQSKLSFSVINNAGHNAHKEKPAQFALLIKNKLLK